MTPVIIGLIVLLMLLLLLFRGFFPLIMRKLHKRKWKRVRTIYRVVRDTGRTEEEQYIVQRGEVYQRSIRKGLEESVQWGDFLGKYGNWYEFREVAGSMNMQRAIDRAQELSEKNFDPIGMQQVFETP